MTTITQTYSPAAPAARRRSSDAVAADKALVARIRASVESNPAAVVRALEVLYAAQTETEKYIAATTCDNGCGFSMSDARTGTWLVETVIAEGRARGASDSSVLRGKALSMGRSIVGKYAATQLLAAAKTKQADVAYEAAVAADEAAAEVVVEETPLTADGRVPYWVVARMMAGSNPSAEEGDFWDDWKDEMKDSY